MVSPAFRRNRCGVRTHRGRRRDVGKWARECRQHPDHGEESAAPFPACRQRHIRATDRFPRLDNPLIPFVGGVAKIGGLTMPMRLNETTRTLFRKTGCDQPARQGGPISWASIPAAIGSHPELSRRERARTVFDDSHLGRPTILKAGVGPNVIPSQAEAISTCGLYPTKTSRNSSTRCSVWSMIRR